MIVMALITMESSLVYQPLVQKTRNSTARTFIGEEKENGPGEGHHSLVRGAKCLTLINLNKIG